MHRAEVIVGGERLNEEVVLTELAAQGLPKGMKCGLARLAAFNSSVRRVTKDDILIRTSQQPRRAMVVVGTFYDSTMDFADEVFVHGATRGL